MNPPESLPAAEMLDVKLTVLQATMVLSHMRAIRDSFRLNKVLLEEKCRVEGGNLVTQDAIRMLDTTLSGLDGIIVQLWVAVHKPLG